MKSMTEEVARNDIRCLYEVIDTEYESQEKNRVVSENIIRGYRKRIEELHDVIERIANDKR